MMVLLAGCGVAVTVGPPGDSSATAENLTTTAHPEHANVGQTIQFTVTVTGPADYETGCVQTVHLWADTADAAARRVWEQPVPQVECMVIAPQHLESGQTASFRVFWPTTGIPHGAYFVHGLLRFALPPGAASRVRENIPPVMVTVG
jgi:hypothetical protein